MSSGEMPWPTRPSRTWRALAACTVAQPVPPWSMAHVPAGTCALEAVPPQDAQGVGGEIIDSASGAQEPVEGLCHAHDQLVVGPGPVDGAHLAGVEVLDQDHATGRQRIHQAGEHVESLGDVLKHQPLVDHVPRAGRDGLRHEVQCAHFELRAAVTPAPAGVEVHGQHPPGGHPLDPPSIGQSIRSRTHLQAARPRRQPQSRQVAAGDGIEHGLQPGEAIGRLELGVRQEVRRLIITHPRGLPRRVACGPPHPGRCAAAAHCDLRPPGEGDLVVGMDGHRVAGAVGQAVVAGAEEPAVGEVGETEAAGVVVVGVTAGRRCLAALRGAAAVAQAEGDALGLAVEPCGPSQVQRLRRGAEHRGDDPGLTCQPAQLGVAVARRVGEREEVALEHRADVGRDGDPAVATPFAVVDQRELEASHNPSVRSSPDVQRRGHVGVLFERPAERQLASCLALGRGCLHRQPRRRVAQLPEVSAKPHVIGRRRRRIGQSHHPERDDDPDQGGEQRDEQRDLEREVPGVVVDG